MNALVKHEASAVGALATFDEMERASNVLASSGLFGVKNATQALALMLVAQAEGSHYATVATDFDVIQNKARRTTHSVLARFQAMGGKLEWHELNEQRAEATFSHPKGGTLRLEWTVEMARKAGLTGKDNWKSYARAMLRARLIAEGVRSVYPAAIGGFQVPEEAMGPQLGEDETVAPPPPTIKHMGAAEVVQPEAQEQQQALPALPDDLFSKGLPVWQKAINKGVPHAEVIARVESANPGHALSETQKATILSLKKQDAAQGNGAPAVNFAHVADAIAKAKDMDSLALAGDLIRQVPQEDLRAELQAKFDEREQALTVEG